MALALKPLLAAVTLGVICTWIVLAMLQYVAPVAFEFWAFPLLVAAVFLGPLYGAISWLVAASWVGTTLGLEAALAIAPEALTQLLQLVFVGVMVARAGSLRVIHAQLLFCAIAVPAYVIIEWKDFLDDTGWLTLTVINVTLSNLLCGCLVQAMCLNAGLVSLLDLDARNLIDKVNYYTRDLIAIAAVPIVVFLGLAVSMTESTSGVERRVAFMAREAEAMLHAHERAALSQLQKLRLNQIAAAGNTRSVDDLYAVFEDYPFVCALFASRRASAQATSPLRNGAAHCETLPDNWTDANNPVAATAPTATAELASLTPFNPRFAALSIYGEHYVVDLSQLALYTIQLLGHDPATPFYRFMLQLVQQEAEQPVSIAWQDRPIEGPINYRAPEFTRQSLRVTAWHAGGFLLPDSTIKLRSGLEIDSQDLAGYDVDTSLQSLLFALLLIGLILWMVLQWQRGLMPRLQAILRLSREWEPGKSLEFEDHKAPNLVRELHAVEDVMAQLVEDSNKNFARLQAGDERLNVALTRMEEIFESVRAPLAVLNSDLKVLSSNNAYRDIAEAVAPLLTEPGGTDHEADAPPLLTAIDSVVNGEAKEAEVQFKMVVSGDEKSFVARIGPLSHRGARTAGRDCILALNDITPVVQARAQLVHSAKLASIGEMAAGMAHEINQPLNVIRMSSQNLMRSARKDDIEPEQMLRKLERIGSQVDRAARIISGMKAFGRKTDLEPQRFVPADVIASATELLREQLKLDSIQLEYQPLAGTAFVRADPTAIEQVLINLITNARDAILEANVPAGIIEISESLADGDHVISVQDNGGGIPDAVIEHIFDPFFTTKELGKGTGLGLSISYGILTELGGSLSAHNHGNGARFQFRIPRA